MSKARYVTGLRAVEQLLQSRPEEIRKIYAEYRSQNPRVKAALERARQSGLDVQSANRARLKQMSGEVRHQGIVAEIARSSVLDEAALRTLVEERLGDDAGRPLLLLLLDGIQDPHNLGSIIRSSEALGARCVFVTGKGAPLSSSVVDRVSAGATLHLPVFEQGGLAGVLKFARENEFWVVAAAGDSPEADQTRQIDFAGIAELPPASRLVLLIGNEGEGLKKSLLDGADYVIGIPLRGKIDSLNAGVAAGILIERLIHR